MKNLLIIGLLSLSPVIFGQHVNWVTVEEAQALNKLSPRPFLVDVYTNWCGWCKKMEATTYRNSQIVSYINNNFYAIKFNAETKDSIYFNGQLYTNKGGHTRSTHALTNVFVSGRKSYPSTFFCTKEFVKPMTVPGYLKPNDLAPLLSFYADKAYQGTNVNQYMTDFKKAFSEKNEVKEVVGVTPKIKNSKKKKKKEAEQPMRKSIFILTDDTKPASQVFMNEILTDSLVVSQLDSTFEVLSFDVNSKDTLDFNGQKLSPTSGKHQAEHFFLSNVKDKTYPSFVLLNEKKELITIIPQYMDRLFLSVVIEYFEGNLYKEGGVTFQEFYQKKSLK